MSKIATKWQDGRWNVWRKDRWVIQFFFPHIHINRVTRELKIDFDTVMRISLSEKAAGIVILGFGFGASMSPNNYRKFRNDGTCVHGVSLNRACAECKEKYPE